MKMFVRGAWIEGSEQMEVVNPFDGSVVDTVPVATAAEVDAAIAGAVEGAAIMREMPAYERYEILQKTTQLMHQHSEELGRIISMEEGKVLAEGLFEASRSATTMEVSAEEAKRLSGEVLPIDGAPGTRGKLAFTLRVPCGVVAAITPFNFPLNLVCHKVGPALAAGNSVLLKPASDTPLVALKMVEILLEAGVPPLAISCVTGSGGHVGQAICSDPRIHKISFTGSAEVGEQICRTAGIKRVTMELGSNSPLIVMGDADLNKVVDATVATGYANAGQVCISTQRVLAISDVYDDLVAALQPRVEALQTGNQLMESTQVGPMVREGDAVRVSSWIEEAVSQGARLVCGGQRDAAQGFELVAKAAAGGRRRERR